MKQVISVKDLEEMLRSGKGIRALPDDAILTPSARDFLHDLEGNGKMKTAPAGGKSATGGKPQPPARPLSSKSSKAELEAFFDSPYCHDLKLQICEIGRRLWQRAYVDGNGGNIAIRVGDDIALCTPTLVSKGFMKPEDMCLVDFEGNQLCGEKKRTSEILMHLQMMKRQPKDVASVHCHPPYATALPWRASSRRPAWSRNMKSSRRWPSRRIARRARRKWASWSPTWWTSTTPS